MEASEQTLFDESPEPGSFIWCVEQFSVGDNPVFAAIGKTVCLRWSVWPEQLVGRRGAGDAVSAPDRPPLATGHIIEPDRRAKPVLARRTAWYLAYQLGSEVKPVSTWEIAKAFGDRSTGTVSPWLRTLDKFKETYPDIYSKYGGISKLIVELETAVNDLLENNT